MKRENKTLFFILITFLFLLLLVNSVFSEVVISEIMYNPSSKMGSDTDLEWIELFNKGPEEAFFSNVSINGKKTINFTILSKEYLVISNELIDGKDADKLSFESFYGNSDRVWNYTDRKIDVIERKSLTLGNTKGHIVIKADELTINVSYLDDFGGDGNGHSIELVNNSWIESREIYGTPGRKNTANPNFVPRDARLRIIVPDKIYTQKKYTNFFKIEFLRKKNCSKKDSLSIDYALTNENNLSLENKIFTKKKIGCSSRMGEFIFEEEGSYVICGGIVNEIKDDINLLNNNACQNFKVIDTTSVPCDVSLNLSTEKMFFQNGERISMSYALNDKSFPYTIDYWIEDLLGNIVKNKLSTNRISKKSFTPKITEQDKVFLIKFRVFPQCKDSNKNDNSAEKMAIIINPSIIEASSVENNESKSSILITKISPTKKNYGDLLKVETEIYHGSTGKYSVQAYVEKDDKKISETTKINLKDKYTNYKVTLPIQIKPNCNLLIKEGSAYIVVEGLDEKEEEKISLEGVDKTLCRDYLSYVKETNKKGSGSSKKSSKLSYQIVDLPSSVYSGEKMGLQVTFQGDSSNHDFKTSSYLYRGSKCYSCCSSCEINLERDDNQLEFSLDKGKLKTITLPLNIDEDMLPGEYKIKVKIVKDNQKTSKDLIKTIQIKNKPLVKSEKNVSVNPLLAAQMELSPSPLLYAKKNYQDREGMVVYESSSSKAKNLIPYFLIISFILLLFIILKKS